MKLADKEIIKNLEWLMLNFPKIDNPMDDLDKMSSSINLNCKNAIELINRLQDENKALINGQETLQNTIVEQKAEIERLQKTAEEAVNCFTRMESLYKVKCKELECAKSETIKEVAERFEYFALHEDPEINAIKCKDYESYMGGFNQFRLQIVKGIKNLVKEMEETSDAENTKNIQNVEE